MHRPFIVIIPTALYLNKVAGLTGIKKDRIALLAYFLLFKSSNNLEKISKIETDVTLLANKVIRVEGSGAYLY